MADLKTGAKFIEKDPPLADQETKSIGRKILDYLAYLKEQLNFIFSNYGRRLTDADGHINELTRTAEETMSVIYDPETGLVSRIQQNANAISAEVTRATGKEGELTTAIGANTAAIAVNADAITTKVSTTDYTGNNIVSMINQSATTVDISADKINLNGAVTANNNVQILQNGTIKAINADISGKFTMTDGSISITTSDIAYDVINLNYGANSLALTPGGISLSSATGSYTNRGSYNTSSYFLNSNGYQVSANPSDGFALINQNVTDGYAYAQYGWGIINLHPKDQNSTASINVFPNVTGTNGRTTLDNTGLTFRNTSDVTTASYPSSLTASRALIAGAGGTVSTSSVTATELSYLSGVTSNIQTQLNNKGNPTHISGGTTLSATTAYKYSGVSFTVPAGKYFVVTAHAYYSAVSPAAVCISNSSTSVASGAMQIEGLVDSQNTRARVTWSGYLSSATTYYIWAKAASAGNLGIGVDGFYL